MTKLGLRRNSTPCADRVRIEHNFYENEDSHHASHRAVGRSFFHPWGAKNSVNDGRGYSEGRERRARMKHPHGNVANYKASAFVHDRQH